MIIHLVNITTLNLKCILLTKLLAATKMTFSSWRKPRGELMRFALGNHPVGTRFTPAHNSIAKAKMRKYTQSPLHPTSTINRVIPLPDPVVTLHAWLRGWKQSKRKLCKLQCPRAKSATRYWYDMLTCPLCHECMHATQPPNCSKPRGFKSFRVQLPKVLNQCLL